jgi:amidase
LDALLADGSILFLPAARGPAPMATDYDSEASLAKLADARNAALAIGAPASLARLPCVVVPTIEIEGEPVGLMMMSRRGTDEALLAFAEKLAWVIGLKVP